MLWRVIIDGKNSGIIESNYAFGSQYWKKRERIMGFRVRLELI